MAQFRLNGLIESKVGTDTYHIQCEGVGNKTTLTKNGTVIEDHTTVVEAMQYIKNADKANTELKKNLKGGNSKIVGKLKLGEVLIAEDGEEHNIRSLLSYYKTTYGREFETKFKYIEGSRKFEVTRTA